MNFFNFVRQNRNRPSRTTRKARLAVEGCESRQLMSGATISGTAFQDLSGNGNFTDDALLANVTIDLYKSGSSTVLEHTLTNASGNFSFTNLSAGNYSVQQVVPSGFLPTGALNGYPVSLASNQSAPGKDFEDFKLSPLPTLSNLKFTVTTPAGKSTTVTSLDGNVKQGDVVTARFNLETADQMTLVAYKAPNGDFDTSNLQKQVIFSEASNKAGTGSETLTVTVPDGYFQLDFVAGCAITDLEVNPNVTYHAQDRFIQGADGGTQLAPAAIAATNNGTTTTTSGIVTTSNTPTPAATVLVLDPDAATPLDVQARKH